MELAVASGAQPGAVRVVGIEFSGRTYSVKVEEGSERFWPIVELDGAGRLKEALCVCEELPCRHVRCALSAITAKGSCLHQRFEHHFWHQLLYSFSQQTQEQEVATTPDGVWISCGQQWLRIEGSLPELTGGIQQIAAERPQLNERNSIKFSNLSLEQLQAWSKGEPGPWLRYELSLWSDLAKLLFLQDDRHALNYYVQLQLEQGQPRLLIDAELYEVEMQLTEQQLELALGRLGSLDRDLVRSLRWQDWIESIRPVKRGKAAACGPQPAYELIYRQGAPSLEKRRERMAHPPAFSFGSWGYWPGEGLWQLDPHWQQWPSQLSGSQLTQLLEEWATGECLPPLAVNREPAALNYTMEIDARGYLQLDPYMWQPHELGEGGAFVHGSWICGKVIQKIADSPWYTPFEVAPSRAEAFIEEHLELLSESACFPIQLDGIPFKLRYTVQPGQSVTLVDPLEQEESLQRYGRWLYTPSRGLFWRKPQTLQGGLRVKWRELESFAQHHEKELQDVEGFWAEQSPLEGHYLRVEWDGARLQLLPYERLKPAYRDKPLYWSGTCSFVPGEGFFIHQDQLLPEPYRRPQKVARLDDFLEQQWPQLQRFVDPCPVQLSPIEHPSLLIKALLSKPEPGAALRLQADLMTAQGEVPLEQLLPPYQGSRRWLLSEAGLIDRGSELGQWLERQRRGQGYAQVESLELLRLRSLIPVHSKEEEISRLLDAWLDPKRLPPLDLLCAQLRPYQELGVQWMWQLMQYGLGALLCDDMGLGKTHQVMAIMAALIGQKRGARVLVVCPTSVLYHWQDKVALFLPSLNLTLYHGGERSLDRAGHIVLTSYGVLRQDRSLLAQHWDLVVFDEIQLAKNSRSQIWRACGRLDASYKIGLSGTPIENSLQELKALFDLIFPGYLPSEALFKSQFVLPIEKYHDPEAVARLRRVIQPLVLRRCKREVLTQLPEKIEERGFCEMSQEQNELYHAVLERSREQIVEQLRDSTQPVPYLHIFALLSSLKQICDHPACYWRNRRVPAALTAHQSGKWDLFTTLLDEALASSQKVVVFSQYLAMLDLIEEHLEARGIGYSGLRGSSRRRGQAVHRFQEDPQCQVFVASLTAGGVGIELTAASVVILYDRWWNAAREQQAVDRVHRLGQSRGVQVFRLITCSSIEERIDQIIARKGRLMEEVTPVDAADSLKQFSRQELLQMLDDFESS